MTSHGTAMTYIPANTRRLCMGIEPADRSKEAPAELAGQIRGYRCRKNKV